MNTFSKIYSTETFEKYIKFAKKILKSLQNCLEINKTFKKFLNILLKIKCITFKQLKLKLCLQKLIKFEIHSKIKNFKIIFKTIKKISKILMDFIKVCESFEQFK